jgi:hypothetical protein
VDEIIERGAPPAVDMPPTEESCLMDVTKNRLTESPDSVRGNQFTL